MFKSRRYCNLFIIILFGFLSVLSIIAYSKFNFSVLFNTSDLQYHIRRIMELNESIHNNFFFPVYSFNYFHGSAFMGMYPYLSLYPFIIIHLFIKSIVQSYYIYLFVFIFIAFLTSFFGSISYARSFDVSFLFSLIYGLSSVLSFTIFTSGDLGIFTSYAFLPLVIFGFLNIIRRLSDRYLEFSIGISLIVYCQVMTVVVIILFLFVWIIINVKDITKCMIFEFSKSLILVILLTALVWLPMFRILLLNNIHTVINPSVIIPLNFASFIKNFGILSIFGLVFVLFFFNKLNRINKQMYILSIIIVLFSSKLVPWGLLSHFFIFHVFNIFQFTFRFLIIPQILLSYLLAVAINKFLSGIKYHKLFFLVFTIFTLICQIGPQFLIVRQKLQNNSVPFDEYYAIRNPSYYYLNSNKSVYNMINGYFNHSDGYGSDYYPVMAFPKRLLLSKNRVIYGNKSLMLKHIGYNKFEFVNFDKINKLSLPLVHYKCERLRIFMNHHLIRYYVNKNSLITLKNISKGNHKLNIEYLPDSHLIIVKYLLNIIGLVLVIIIFVRNQIYKFRKN